jgi:DNA-binding transcriptional MerR regulator
MSIKMAELTKLSNTSKSTILYYVKEGLLPQPQKPKPNVHLYDDCAVSIIRFIKYMQESLHYSITEIKSIIQDNKIDFRNESEIVINYLIAISGKNREEEIKNIIKKAQKYEVNQELFDAYEQKAKELATLEYQMGAKLLTKNSNNDKNDLHKLIFDIILTYKPYIFNQATLREHKVRVYENTKGQQS